MKTWATPDLLFFILVCTFVYTIYSKHWQNKSCKWPDLSPGPLSSLSQWGTAQTLLKSEHWLWLSWQSGRLQFQRSAGRIQSSAKFIMNLFSVNVEKTKMKKNMPIMAVFLKKCCWNLFNFENRVDRMSNRFISFFSLAQQKWIF